MLIVDQLKKNDPQLRTVVLVILCGLGVLAAGLWWIQIVSVRDYQAHLEMQAYRTVRIPAVRGRILDRNGVVLAENRPTYNVSLYLEELRKNFDAAINKETTNARAMLKQKSEQEQQRLGRKLTAQERKAFLLSTQDKELLRQRARYLAASNVVFEVSSRLQQPISLDFTNFERHYAARLALPYPILTNINPLQIARFEEQSTTPMGVDLEIQSTRVYPHETSAAHVLGFLKRDDSSVEGEEAFFSYRLPDYRGVTGIEAAQDQGLRGKAGSKSVLVNNVGYRQTENIWVPAEAGQDVVLTIDLGIQQAAEHALHNAVVAYTGPVLGAAVVMDVQSGNLLALASSPSVNPNYFIQGAPKDEWQRLDELHAQMNRATSGSYYPGSIFKLVVGLACLESGLNPAEKMTVAENPAQRGKGHIIVHGRSIKDTAPPGDYDFRRALMLSCNSYFISNGLRVGPEKIISLAQRVHFGERIGLKTHQEVAGSLPSIGRVSSGWGELNTANISIGQDPVKVTPLQIAVLTSAIANGGKVLWPRLVQRLESPEPASSQGPVNFPAGQVRDQLGLSEHSLQVLYDAMLADTEDREGTGKHVRDHEPLPGLHIFGKTGTAQIQDIHGNKTGQTTWFASFASVEKSRYAVVIMIENGKSGGETCSPVAGHIYAALQKRETAKPKPESMVKN